MAPSLALPCLRTTASLPPITVAIGDIPISLETADPHFRDLLAQRYAGFINANAAPSYHFKVEITEPSTVSDEDVRVYRQGRLWHIERGDFRAELDPRARNGWVRQARNPYSIDTVLRIAHSLVLAEEGGFLLHSASALRNGHAFLFAGVSGAGKTTISRLAPDDAAVLTDEISYVRRDGSAYRAYGTPFAGELARVGDNLSAPLKTLFFLQQGPVHRIDPVDPREAARALLRHILFFARDVDLVQRVFDAAVDFVAHLNVARLTFTPDPGVWELIR
jgi:hypothetical protein